VVDKVYRSIVQLLLVMPEEKSETAVVDNVVLVGGCHLSVPRLEENKRPPPAGSAPSVVVEAVRHSRLITVRDDSALSIVFRLLRYFAAVDVERWLCELLALVLAPSSSSPRNFVKTITQNKVKV